LYKIITINRARIVVIICGCLSSLFGKNQLNEECLFISFCLSSAIIPMSEYSTMEHVLHIHNNHSEHFPVEPYDEYDSPIYTHVERLKSSALILPYTIGNLTNVKCSPKFSFRK
jgi:hypothetical protein